MKNLVVVLVFVLLAMLVASPLTSCLGARVKPAALFPPAVSAWPGVHADILEGLELEESAAAVDAARADALELGDALEASDVAGVRAVDWTTLHRYATEGIAARVTAGEIGEGVAVSLSERLRQFDETILRLRSLQ